MEHLWQTKVSLYFKLYKTKTCWPLQFSGAVPGFLERRFICIIVWELRVCGGRGEGGGSSEPPEPPLDLPLIFHFIPYKWIYWFNTANAGNLTNYHTPDTLISPIFQTRSLWLSHFLYICQLTLRMLGNFYLIVVVGWLFSKLTFSNNSFRNTIRVSNGFVSPDRGSNCL